MSLTVTAQRSYIAGSPQLQITVTGTTGSPNPVDINGPLTSIVRIHADGTRWTVPTDASPRLSGGRWVWLDTLAPFNSGVRYEVKASGVTATSSTTFSPSSKAWLLSPLQAGLAFEIHGIKEIADRVQDSRSGRFEPIGGEAIYLTDGRRNGISGSLKLRVPVAREAALRRLLASDSMVLINTPGTLGWDISWLWVQPNAVTYANPSNLVSYAYREVTVAFAQGAQPFADIVPLWNSGSAAAYFAANNITSAGVVGLYADSSKLQLNART